MWDISRKVWFLFFQYCLILLSATIRRKAVTTFMYVSLRFYMKFSFFISGFFTIFKIKKLKIGRIIYCAVCVLHIKYHVNQKWWCQKLILFYLFIYLFSLDLMWKISLNFLSCRVTGIKFQYIIKPHSHAICTNNSYNEVKLFFICSYLKFEYSTMYHCL